MIVSRMLAAAGLAVVILGGACGLSTYGTQEVGSGGATSSSSVGSGGASTSSSVGSGGATTTSSASSSGGGLGGAGGTGGTGGMTTSSSSSSSGMPTHCSNGKKDMDETGSDCGGPSCAPCPQGQGCGMDTDCAGGLPCQQGICCGTACTGACQSCNGADTGSMTNSGTCMTVVAGKDPGMQCKSAVGGACDGAGMCACGNGKLDPGETDVDCGGPACNKCDNGKLCGGGADCSSTHCFDTGGGTKVCCDQDCTGSCSTCALKISYQNQQQQNVTISWVGQCVPVPSGVQGKCSSGKACNDAQQCVTGKTDFSATCNGGGECASGFCETQFFHQCFPATEAQGAPCISSYWCNSNMCDSGTNLCK